MFLWSFYFAIFFYFLARFRMTGKQKGCFLIHFRDISRSKLRQLLHSCTFSNCIFMFPPGGGLGTFGLLCRGRETSLLCLVFHLLPMSYLSSLVALISLVVLKLLGHWFQVIRMYWLPTINVQMIVKSTIHTSNWLIVY